VPLDPIDAESIMIPCPMIDEMLAERAALKAANVTLNITGTSLETEHEMLKVTFDATLSEMETLKAENERLKASNKDEGKYEILLKGVVAEMDVKPEPVSAEEKQMLRKAVHDAISRKREDPSSSFAELLERFSGVKLV
jgi:DNA helicase HerA-like ATPase